MKENIFSRIFFFVFFFSTLLYTISLAADLQTTLTFDKNSYSDADDVEITASAKMTQSVLELKNDEIITVSLWRKVSDSESPKMEGVFDCQKGTLECSNKWKFKTSDVKNNKFYIETYVKKDGELIRTRSDAYTIPTTGSSVSNPTSNRKPTVEISVDKNSVIREEKIRITVKSSDKDRNLNDIWLIANINGGFGTWKSYACKDEQRDSCEYVWDETINQEGNVYFQAFSHDLEGAWSDAALTGSIDIKSEMSKFKLSSGVNRFVFEQGMVGKSVKDFDGYNTNCGSNIWLFKTLQWEEKSIDYKFASSDSTSGIVVYCGSSTSSTETSSTTTTTATSAALQKSSYSGCTKGWNAGKDIGCFENNLWKCETDGYWYIQKCSSGCDASKNECKASSGTTGTGSSSGGATGTITTSCTGVGYRCDTSDNCLKYEGTIDSGKKCEKSDAVCCKEKGSSSSGGSGGTTTGTNVGACVKFNLISGAKTDGSANKNVPEVCLYGYSNGKYEYVVDEYIVSTKELKETSCESNTCVQKPTLRCGSAQNIFKKGVNPKFMVASGSTKVELGTLAPSIPLLFKTDGTTSLDAKYSYYCE